MKLRPVLIAFSLLVFLGVASSNVLACSCMVSETVEKELARSGNVVVLKVKSVEKAGQGEDTYGYGGIKTTTLTVESVFKGNFKIGDTITFAQGGGADCIWAFGEKSVGESYLFYLGDKPLDPKQIGGMIASTSRGNLSVDKNVWIASTCSRSGNIKDRTLDLKYLGNVPTAKSKTRLSGNITQRIETSVNDGFSGYKKLQGRNVRVVGGGKDVTVQTDENGDYEIYDLSPGRYKVSVEPLAGYKTSPFDWRNADSVDVEIRPREQAEQDFEYYIHNSISGRFFDSNQRPLKDVCMDLVPAEGEKARSFRNFDCTERDGTFKFTQVPAGKYLIVINEKNEITADEPFGTFYYPDKVQKDAAGIITIAAGEHLKDLIITAPRTADVITVSGVLLYEGGEPVVDESVEFYSNESLERQKNEDYKTEDSRASTDGNGRFSLRILKGQKGRIVGSMITYLGKYENCPKLDELVLAQVKNPNGITVTDIETDPVEINAVSDMSDLKLRFPFPKCTKPKKNN